MLKVMKKANEMGNSILDFEIYISTGKDKYELKWKNKTITVGAFVTKLANPTRTPETVAEFFAMKKVDQDDIKDVGGYVGGMLKGGRRTGNSVASRTMITLDLDHADKLVTDDILDKTEEAMGPNAWVCHSTHKHTNEAPRLRIICFLDRPVTVDEYQAICRKVAEKIGIEWFDDSTYQAHRLMYWPSIPSDAEYVFIDRTTDLDGQEQQLLCADDVLAEYGPEDAWKDSTLWPTSSREASVIQKQIGRQADPLKKKGIVGAFCRVYDIRTAIKEFIPSYRHDGGNRYTYTEGTTAKGVVIYEEKWSYSNHDTDPAARHLCNSFDLVRLHKFGHLDEKAKEDTPIVKMPSFKAMAEWAEEQKAVNVELISSMFDNAVEFGEVAEGDEGGSIEWIDDLQTTKDGAIKPTFGNVCDILTHDPTVAGLPWTNSFTGLKEYRKVREWSAEDTLDVRKYLRDKYQIDVSLGNVADAIDWKADKQRHHPVKEYLEGLQGTWDGVKRAERLWIDYLGEEDNIYTRETARCWLLAAVTRIFQPGYKFDYVPVLGGKQGIRKSTLCSVLAKKQEWFGELSTFDDQKAVEQMRGHWIMEIAELQATNRNELEQQKFFLSSVKSTVRLAYRRDSATYPRQCVFVGSTNQIEYLKDSTGNRRWWPIACDRSMCEGGKVIDVEALARVVDQIWAEVMDIWCDPDSETELSRAAIKIALARQEERMQSDEWEGVVMSWLGEPGHKRRYEEGFSDLLTFDDAEEDMEERDRVCVLEVWQDCLGMKHPMKKYDANRIAAILNKHEDEWEQKRLVRFGKRFGSQRGWIRRREICPF